MLKTLKITCPREKNKTYMSFASHQYVNKLDIYHNSMKIFTDINDAEENLPIIQEKNIDIALDSLNTFEFRYLIRFDGVEENCKILWQIKPINYLSESHLQLIRYHAVKGAEKISDDFCCNIKINQHCYTVGKEYHLGEQKFLYFKDMIDTNGYCFLSLETKKVFKDCVPVTYDQLLFEIL